MRSVRSFVVMILLAVLSVFSYADNGSKVAQEFINKARTGFQPLTLHPLLEAAAKNHSHYMALNNARGHQEKEGCPGFTGKKCSDRMTFSGYPSRLYIENLSSGQESWASSVEELMSAIYHRLGFLSFYLDEVGFARSVNSSGISEKSFYSYVMGSSGFRKLCEQGITGTLTGMCRDPEITVDESQFYSIGEEVGARSAEYVIYPWQGQRNVPSSFLNNEQPAPFPDSIGVAGRTGQPISIHFNPVKMSAKSISVLRFALKDDQGREVALLPRLDRTTDTNRLFTDFDFAWFPRQPLKNNTSYTAQLLTMIDRHPFAVNWSFHTSSKM